MDTIQFCNFALEYLNKSDSFGRDFCKLKTEFFLKYQKGFVFSTTFGANFFEEIIDRVTNERYLVASLGERLGQYDENFNKWLRQVINI